MAHAASQAGSPFTSVITWIGYDAPQSIIPDAGSEKYALGAEKDLQRFQDGLRATHAGPSAHNTVIGHSYGTTTIGYAARDGSVNANDVSKLADGSFGPNPSDPEFGGQTFNSAPGDGVPSYVPGLSDAVHSQYWTLDNSALDNMGRVIAGKPTH